LKQPNVVFVFADEWRAQTTGYAGELGIRTPVLDRLSGESINLVTAVSNCPLCTPYRGCLLTGQYPLTHGLFVNDVSLDPAADGLAKSFARGGYDTAYVGKWHVDGHGRDAYIPPERQQGFQHWQVLECSHDYNHSPYYEGHSPEIKYWDGYDAIAQTRAAQSYIRQHDNRNPFLLVLSWGPPHFPYDTAPEVYRALYSDAPPQRRPNVPLGTWIITRDALAGYYAHCSVLDTCVGDLLATLEEQGLDENTIFVFTSDHGDAIGSHNHGNKQAPWDECIRVPFLLRWPARFGRAPRRLDALIGAPDLMPTLLGLCDLPIPGSVEGLDFSDYLAGGPDPSDGAALIAVYHPIADWAHCEGGREYRGLRTKRHTYVRALDGPWMLFDNQADPYQMHNLVDDPQFTTLRGDLEQWLQHRLNAMADRFLPGLEYMRQWGYPMDETETVPIPPSVLRQLV
jgi:arylsulfatase A-like enzyme